MALVYQEFLERLERSALQVWRVGLVTRGALVQLVQLDVKVSWELLVGGVSKDLLDIQAILEPVGFQGLLE